MRPSQQVLLVVCLLPSLLLRRVLSRFLFVQWWGTFVTNSLIPELREEHRSQYFLSIRTQLLLHALLFLLPVPQFLLLLLLRHLLRSLSMLDLGRSSSLLALLLFRLNFRGFLCMNLYIRSGCCLPRGR
jgi:hypothetical protein